MLTNHSIQRSLERLTIGAVQAMSRTRHAADDYRLCEREVQYQVDFSGTAGELPSEASITITFDYLFIGPSQGMRDSDLVAPQVRKGFELTSSSSGVIPYAYIAQWTRDADGIYTGAVVNVGVHAPAVATLGLNSVIPYSGVMHIAFQGYAMPVDPDDDQDATG